MALARHITPAPFFSLSRAAWIPYAISRDDKTGAFHGVEGPRGIASYREAVEASRFLLSGIQLDKLLTE